VTLNKYSSKLTGKVKEPTGKLWIGQYLCRCRCVSKYKCHHHFLMPRGQRWGL